MKLGLCLLVFGCILALNAQTQMTVDQIAQTVRSSIALKTLDDKKIADYLKKVTMTERLTDKTIQDLMAQGAGPKTVHALQELRDKSVNLKPPATDSTYSPATVTPDLTPPGPASVTIGPKKVFPPPDSVRQREILDEIKQYALTYTQNLPNFICTQVTRRYVDPNMADHYRIIDTINTQLRYSEGREKYQVVSLNGKAVNMSMEELKGGTVSTGEFGSLMRGIFEAHSAAEINWDHWGTLRGKKVAVFNYFIDSGHSTYSIDYNGEQRIITAYKGLFYADEFTGAISRITFQAVDIPAGFPVNEAYEVLDYDDVQISGNTYICPLRADVRLRAGREKTKNEVEFRLYKKFGTESTIIYDTPEPLSSDKTTEQPSGTGVPPPSKTGVPPPQ